MKTIKQSSIFVFSTLLLLSTYTYTYAETRYIDDTLRVPLRSGPSTQHRILNFLTSGTKVEQQEVNEEDPDWARVLLGQDQEGWIQVRYLKNTPAAKQLLAYSQQELAKVKAQNKEQQQTINNLRKELKDLNAEYKKLSKHSEAADKELAHIKDISQNAIRLDHSNSELLEQNELLKVSQEENQQLITKLESNQKNTGMVYGAIFIIVGLILGLVLPKFGRSKNDGWV